MKKQYKLNMGFSVTADEHSCLFCDHCTDIFYDSGGIYLTICDIDKDIEEGATGDCTSFVCENKAGEST